MNEQVYSLAEQASEYAVLNPSDEVLQSETEDAKVEIPKAFIDKFAELIVRECVEVCNRVYFDNYPDAEDFERSEEGDAIKKHFGVEG